MRFSESEKLLCAERGGALFIAWVNEMPRLIFSEFSVVVFYYFYESVHVVMANNALMQTTGHAARESVTSLALVSWLVGGCIAIRYLLVGFSPRW